MKLNIICAVALWLIPIAVGATTSAETNLSQAPMPHEKFLTGGSLVKVHRASLRGHQEGNPDNQARLVEMRAQIEQCVSQHQASGTASNPPKTWPDYLISFRDDTYSSVNRTIRYWGGVGYFFNAIDCSLTEEITAHADLISSKGTCRMDLKNKEAKGVCDANAHADAPILAHGATQPAMERLSKVAGNPIFAAQAAKMQKMKIPTDTRTADKKVILGIECEVWAQAGGIENGTMCLAPGGTFEIARSAGNHGGAGLLLEQQARTGIQMKAVAAKLDDLVDEAVFAPYLQGGFQISSGTRSK